ncbi:MAG: hypothetical protein HW416_759 [Chloroflexi bacterium]|nr:hypothetical protein [Chloroflexota bacterium]
MQETTRRGIWAWPRIELVAAGVALEIWALVALVRPPGADIPRHVALMLLAMLVYAASLHAVLSPSRDRMRADLLWIFAVAVALRVTMLFTTPSLSDDIYRAVWDARLVHAGVNPYLYAPADPALAIFRDETIWPSVNHKEQRTPYPPGAELFGGLAYALVPEQLLSMQLLAAGADLLALGMLGWLLFRLGLDPRRSLAIAWSPLSIVHFAHSGHNDAIIVAGLVGAALLLSFGRKGGAAVALAIATMTKATPVLALPSFARAGGRWLTLTWAVCCAMVTLPFIGAGPLLWSGIAEEAGGARFNESAHLVIERALSLLGPGVGALGAAAFAAFALLAATLMAYVRGGADPRSALVGGSRVLAVYLLVAPVVEPWYLTWLAPLVAFELRRGNGLIPFAANDALAVTWLAGAVTLTDLTYLPGNDSLWPAIRAIEYLPMYAILAFWIVGSVRHRNARNTVSTGHDTSITGRSQALDAPDAKGLGFHI